MRERLDAGNKLDAEAAGVGVDFADLVVRVSAAHITEVGLAVEGVGVLGVKHKHIMPHQRDVAYHLFQRRDGQNAVARAVEHRAEGLVPRSLARFAAAVRFRKQSERTEEKSGLRIREDGGAAFAPDGEPARFGFFGGQLQTVGRFFDFEYSEQFGCG